MDLKLHFYVFITALFTSLLMVPFLRKWALDAKVVDVPDARKVHTQTIPRIGGIAIIMAFVFSVLVYVEMLPAVRGILAGGLIIFCTGLVDDLHGIGPRRKFLGEIAACLITIMVGDLYITRLGNLFGGGEVVLPVWIAIPFTVFAVVGVINAINLIDGLDGLSGGVASISLSAFFILALFDGNGPAMALCAGLLGSLLGFLKYNVYPAKIFMGDAGSLGLGFMLGFLAVLMTQDPNATVSPVVPLLILGLPIIDTVTVMGRRILAGGSPFVADKTHVHHKFLELGFEHRVTVIVIYGLSLFWAVIAVVFNEVAEWLLLALYGSLTLLFYFALRKLRQHREWFPLLGMDSSSSIRLTVTYQRIARAVEHLVPLVWLLVVGYLVVAVGLAQSVEDGLWQMAGMLLLVGVTLLYQTRDSSNHFFLALMYVGIVVIEFCLAGDGPATTMLGFSLQGLNDWLFGTIMGIVVLLSVFRQGNRFFLDSVDYLLLAVTILLSVVFSTSPRMEHFSQPFLNAVILFVGIKAVSMFGKRYTRLTVYPILVVLAVIALRGAWDWLG